MARDIGFLQVSPSHEVSGLIKFVGRGDTAVVDAYLSPILRRYVDQVAGELDAERSGLKLLFMMSSGGLTAAHLFHGRDAILSGPAGGIVGAVQTSRIAGYDRIISFDMGVPRPTWRTMPARSRTTSRRRWPAFACAPP